MRMIGSPILKEAPMKRLALILGALLFPVVTAHLVLAAGYCWSPHLLLASGVAITISSCASAAS